MQVRRIVSAAAILSLVLITTGCVTVSVASPEQTRKALAAGNVADKALVYFMAPQIGGFILNIAVNGRIVGKVKDRTFIYCYFDPGSYDLTTDGQFPITSKWKTLMAVESNSTYYIITPYGPPRFNEPASSRRVLSEYYSLSEHMNCGP